MLLQITNTGGVNFADVRLSTKTFPSNQTVADKQCCSMQAFILQVYDYHLKIIYSVLHSCLCKRLLNCFYYHRLWWIGPFYLLESEHLSWAMSVSVCMMHALPSCSVALFQVRIWKSRLSRLIVIQSFKSILHSVSKITENPWCSAQNPPKSRKFIPFTMTCNTLYYTWQCCVS